MGEALKHCDASDRRIEELEERLEAALADHRWQLNLLETTTHQPHQRPRDSGGVPVLAGSPRCGLRYGGGTTVTKHFVEHGNLPFLWESAAILRSGAPGPCSPFGY
ncbi:MAG: hypothetical protein OXN89_05255 [Bryobacterales bacterium]|nr:hypothetical protein [Bryobacterales bacterium]